MLVRFDDFTIDTQRFELRGPTGPVHMEPQVFDVLTYLVRHRDRVVPKSELLEQIWGSRFVSESTLTSRIKAARRATGDDGEQQRVIATARGRGFRFVAEAIEISADDQGAGQTSSEPGPGESARSAGLPVPLGRLVGRDREVADLTGLLGDARLVTVVGPGGVGKTRCAIESARAAAAMQDLDADFVDLTTTSEPDEVPRVVAEAAGVPVETPQGAIAALSQAFRSERRLLVLDNAEHVLDGVADLTRHLRSAPGVRILVTSRERLRLSGEQVYALAPLATRSPTTGRAPAIELFELAGRRMDPDFEVGPDNLHDVESLCDAVDGLPLGIELVAAHLRLLPPAALRRHLGDRLATVPHAARDAPPRQQTMGDTIEWSIHLLDADERRMLARLSVFRVGADLAGVEEVALPDLHLDAVSAVATMTDKSMLRRTAGADGSPRFGMLSLVRQYVAQTLDDSADRVPTRGRHAAYHHDLVHDTEERRWSDLASVWSPLLSERFADLEAALEHDFTAGDPVRAASTVAALYGFWHRDGRFGEGETWTQRALAHAKDLSKSDRGLVHMGAGYLGFFAHRTDRARQDWEWAVDLFTSVGHDRYRALSMVDAAGTWMGQPAHQDKAIALCQEGTRLSRRVGEAALVAHAVNVLGELQRLAGFDDDARAAYEEGLGLAHDIGDESHQTVFELNLSVLALRRGDLEEATSWARSALGRAVRMRRQVLAASVLVAVAGIGVAVGEEESAALILGAAEGGLEALGAGLGPGDEPHHDRFRQGVLQAVGPDRLEELSSAGRRLSLADAAEEALHGILAR